MDQYDTEDKRHAAAKKEHAKQRKIAQATLKKEWDERESAMRDEHYDRQVAIIEAHEKERSADCTCMMCSFKGPKLILMLNFRSSTTPSAAARR